MADDQDRIADDDTAAKAQAAMQAELARSLLYEQERLDYLASLKPGAPDYPVSELAQAFPKLTGDDFDALVYDIRTNGVRDPVILYAGEILDGQNRTLAAKAAGTTDIKVERFKGTHVEAVAFVISKNLARRHLDAGQRATIAADLANIKVGEFRGNQHTEASANLQTPSVSQAAAAKAVKVSIRSVATAAKIKKADPALFGEVKAGKTTLHAADKKTKAKPKTTTKPTAKKTESPKPKLRGLAALIEALSGLHHELLQHYEAAAQKLEDRSDRWLEGEAGETAQERANGLDEAAANLGEVIAALEALEV